MSKRILWSVQVSPHLDGQLERYIEIDAYQTKSEFIRAAVRKLLREETERLRVGGAQPQQLALPEMTPDRDGSPSKTPGCFGYFGAPMQPNDCETCPADDLCRKMVEKERQLRARRQVENGG